MENGLRIRVCPFCGGKAGLIKKSSNCDSTNEKTYIQDAFYIRCMSCCTQSDIYTSHIYSDSIGNLVIERNGAEMAINAWNRRVIDEISN